MDSIIVTRPVHRFHRSGRIEHTNDELITEFRLTVRLDGEEFVTAIISHALLEEFVLGFLLTRGLIEGPGDVASLRISGGIASVTRRRRLAGVAPPARLLESTGSTNVEMDPLTFAARSLGPEDATISAAVVMDSMEMLARMPVHKRTGGTHCAILFSRSGTALFLAEDIGRHNAVDKVIGGASKNGVDLSDCWLAVAGRLPADMVFKTVMVGIPLVASLAAVTAEGIEIGRRGGVTVIGFCRGARFSCFCHPERLAEFAGGQGPSRQ